MLAGNSGWYFTISRRTEIGFRTLSDLHPIHLSSMTKTALIFLAAILAGGPALAADAPTTAAICKAGIAAVMGRDPKIIRAKDNGDIVRLSYVRENDGSLWEYRCKIEGSEIIWATKTGRWRTDPADEKLRYKAGAKSVTVDYVSADGGVISSDTYTWRQL